ncbi:hypothetical protein PLICRDRAFT_148646 [Plicaturopsis crispa FD-325 SS-3]|nr:hypothetical protein PLICRDRAFT_148646 [Plicaturopsis crispa FD-325 SS-3]
MARGPLITALAFNLLISFLTPSHAQTISTSTPVPPLQWINLSNSLSGSGPPPLKDASIGYDENTRTLLIFGGESEGGFPQSQTYLLNLDSLSWFKPSPPANLQSSPPARSAAVSGGDFAANFRHGHVIIGGKNANGQPLSDVWEYDYINQFWTPVQVTPGGPSRWGAAGGIDTRTVASGSTLNNTFYLVGGADSSGPTSLSDVWEFQISGTLSSNLPNSSVGSWSSSTIGKLPSRVGQAGTVIQQLLVSAGGCGTSSLTSDSCAQQDAYVLDTQKHSDIAPSDCPAPRLSGTFVPNTNGFSSSYTTQAFLMLGTFNTSLWNDGGGLEKGEVAVLDVEAGSWSRILPSGDPGTSGKASFPSPREGAAALSYTSALVGGSRSSATDTIVFGGRDANGAYLSEVWLLRAYNAMLTKSNQSWSNFGNGQLQSGVNASGTGVSIQYLQSCASAIAPLPPSATSSGTPSSGSSSSPSSPSSSQSATRSSFDTSAAHKILAPLSVVLLSAAVILARLGSNSVRDLEGAKGRLPLLYSSAAVAVVAYGVGIGGLASSFSSITITSSLVKRTSPSLILKTGHGKAGLALFIGLYGLVPLLFLLSSRMLRPRRNSPDTDNAEHHKTRESNETAEKAVRSRTTSGTSRGTTPPASPKSRLRNIGGPGPSSWSTPREGSSTPSNDLAAGESTPRGFEVVNRPNRTRRVSGQTLAVPGSDHSHYSPVTAKSLGDISWLERRRSLNAVGELDYALTQASRAPRAPTPGTADMRSTQALMSESIPRSSLPQFPNTSQSVFRIVLHAFLLGLCILSIIALWSSSRAGFAVFVAWTVVFYITLGVLAWNGRPRVSILTAIVSRLRGQQQPIPPTPAAPASPRPTSPHPQSELSFPFPTDNRGPYLHQPAFRATVSDGHDDTPYAHGGPRSVETDADDDDDEDDDTRQRRMEEEMGRRDVSIVTVPKRRLWITNPSTS